jgi:hypothetical protein
MRLFLLALGFGGVHGSLSVILCKLSLAAVVYHIWLQRNAIHHGYSTPTSEEQILNAVI